MPAYFDTGFSVREPMWHGLGLVLDEYPVDWAHARQLAGLDWEPVDEPLYRRVADLTDTGVTEQFVELEDFKGIARSDNGLVLNVPSSEYSVITHAQMGELIEAVVDEGGDGVKFETAGSIRDGRQVWALAYLDEPVTIPGDDSATLPFFAFLNSHDGSAACKVLPTSVRVVCWNTFNAASMQGDKSGRQVVIRHSGNVEDRIEQAKAVLATAREDAAEWVALAEKLASTPIRDDVVLDFLDDFIPIPDGATERVRNGRESRRSTFMKLYSESPTTSACTGTAYGLVQAAGEYLDHLRAFRTTDTYLTRTLLRPEPMKARVLQVVTELAGVTR